MYYKHWTACKKCKHFFFYCAKLDQIWARSKLTEMYDGCINIDTTLAHGTANKYDWAYIFHTLRLLWVYNTSRIQNLMYFNSPKTIIKFCNIFANFWCFHQFQTAFKFVTTSRSAKSTGTAYHWWLNISK